ncbi:MAG: hypothetical protein NTU44_13555 [Bacteroidetes bacterium]|nr:hypothetical protein [Bacteroidota bacterium]
MKQLNFAILILLTGFFSCQSQTSWYKVETKYFTLQFPKKPVMTHSTLLIDGYGNAETTSYTYEPGENGTDPNIGYTIFFVVLPESYVSSTNAERANAYFSLAIENGVKVLKGKKLGEEKVITKNDYPGREYYVLAREGRMKMSSRCYLVRNVYFNFSVGTLSNKGTNESISKFLNSFTLK